MFKPVQRWGSWEIEPVKVDQLSIRSIFHLKFEENFLFMSLFSYFAQLKWKVWFKYLRKEIADPTPAIWREKKFMKAKGDKLF